MKGAFLRVLALAAMLACASQMITACGSSVEGTYSGAGGGMVLELRSSGKARLTMLGEAQDCTYTVSGDKVAITCQGQTLTFLKHDDGSLTPPAGSLVGTMTKSK